MWGQFITKATKATCAAVGRLLAQVAHFANECLNLLLLLKNGLVELLDQVFGETGLDLKIHQSFVDVGVWHVQVWNGYGSFASSIRRFSNSSL